MALPMKVKAIYAYSSEHDDDLKFPEGQIITVTEEEDDDWYVGDYVDSAGVPQSGLFPKNFVERYEPAPPPRPTRAHRPKPAEAPAPEPSSPQLPVASKPKVEEIKSPEIDIAPPHAPAPIEERSAPVTSPKPTTRQFEPAPEPAPAPKPVQSTPARGPPPPVTDKPSSSSFKDRLKAFNQGGGPPPVPFKPGVANTFIKKPFVAPPPSRTAFVPTTREAPPPKVYRREEDPEIAQRRADDDAAAQKAGLAPAEGEEEDAPKPVSLKERIALLQQQQQEQANRNAGTTHKKKPAKPPTKRTESHEAEAAPARDSFDTDQDRAVRTSSDLPREQPTRRPSKGPKVPEVPPREAFSDGNEADQSAAGETTEENEPESSTEDDSTAQRHHQAPVAQPDVGDEEDLTEEGEEEEDESEDEETRRKRELRERMAKISGQGGFNPMFGGGGMGISMPGMGGPPPKKKKPAPERRTNEDEESPAASSAPRVPMPGIAIPGMSRTMSSESAATIGKDAEDEREESSRQAAAAPVLKERASPTMERGAPPPVPGGRPSLEGRPVPPPPAPIESPSAGSESDDEMPQTSTGADLPIRGAPPPVPQSPVEPRSPPSRSSLDRRPTEPSSPALDRRASRLPPPLPISSPTMPPLAQSRPPPPPPPTQAPPTRQGTSDSLHRKALGQTGEDGSEYEGDYDTDIAPGAKHKDALKSHARESSLDESTYTEDIPVRSPPIPSAPYSPPAPTSAPRAVPPLPPTGPPRKSGETSRAHPPPVPTGGQYDDDDEEYDPYKYSPGAAASGSRAPPSRQAPPPSMPPMPPPVPAYQQDEEYDDDDELYSPPTRQSTDRPRKSTDRAPPPLPPQAPPQHDRAPPPLPPQGPPPPHFDAPPPPPAGKAPIRPSVDQERSFNPSTRMSMDPGSMPRQSSSGFRPDVADPGFIAHEIDIGEASKWWSQPNMPPPSIQGRNDVLYEIEDLPRSNQGGQTVVAKEVIILYQDYSQTVITARYDASNADDVVFEQRQEPPPGKLRQDQLENSWNRFGMGISKMVDKMAGSAAINDGSSHSLIIELLRGMPAALPPVGTRAYGALVYANLGNASVQQFDEIRPGDIVSFRNAKFSGKHSGALHSKYSLDVAVHVGVVTEWDGTKRKVRVAEQGRDSNSDAVESSKPSRDKKKKKGKIEVESYRLGDLRSGEVRVWRVVSREFVGWRA